MYHFLRKKQIILIFSEYINVYSNQIVPLGYFGKCQNQINTPASFINKRALQKLFFAKTTQIRKILGRFNPNRKAHSKDLESLQPCDSGDLTFGHIFPLDIFLLSWLISSVLVQWIIPLQCFNQVWIEQLTKPLRNFGKSA